MKRSWVDEAPPLARFDQSFYGGTGVIIAYLM